MFHIEVNGVPICRTSTSGGGQCVFHHAFEAQVEAVLLRKMNPNLDIEVMPGDCLYRLQEEAEANLYRLQEEAESAKA